MDGAKVSCVQTAGRYPGHQVPAGRQTLEGNGSAVPVRVGVSRGVGPLRQGFVVGLRQGPVIADRPPSA